MIDISDFTQDSSLNLNGSAFIDNGLLNLTPNQEWQRGSAFHQQAIDISGDRSFSTEFSFRLSGEENKGGDGFTFALVENPTALGNNAGNLGYQGIQGQSLAIEFDTWDNIIGGVDVGDNFDDNHLAMVQNGDLANPLARTSAPWDLNGGELLHAWIDYNGINDQLAVYLSDDLLKPQLATLSYNVDLDSLLGSQAYVGFTGATGKATNQHEIHQWQFDIIEPPEDTIDISNFTPNENLNLNGSAFIDNGLLNLTPNQEWQRGSAFHQQAIDVSGDRSFSTEFSFRLSGEENKGGDGFTFALVENPTALGNNAGNLGYQGIQGQSFAIEFDTWDNSGAVDDGNNFGDNHLAMVQNGDLANPLARTSAPWDLNGGELLHAWIDYDGVNDQLAVYLSDDLLKPQLATLSHNVDLDFLLGSQAYVGFTGATGKATNQHEIHQWQFDIIEPPTDDIRINNFIPDPNLNLNGSAFVEDGRLNLTPNQEWQRGSAFYDQTVNLEGDRSFSTEFSFRLSGESQTEGSGFTFALVEDPTALGWNGGNLGYRGIPGQSLAIEFDTWDSRNSVSLGDNFNDNHLAIVTNGDLANPLARASAPWDLNGGELLHAWIDYDGVNDLLKVYLSDDNSIKPEIPTVSGNVELNSLLGSQSYAGFTAGTSGATNQHEIHQWQFSTEPNYGVVELEFSQIEVNEDAQEVLIPVIRTGGSDGRVRLQYTTPAGTAKAGEDYTSINERGFVTFAPGDTRKMISIPILDDDVVEPNEFFNVTVGEIEGEAELGTARTMRVTIIDNEDSGDSISFSQPQFSVSEGATTANVTVLRTGDSTQTVSVEYLLENITAKEGKDYEGNGGILTFESGQTSKLISIPILPDDLPEIDERLRLTLVDSPRFELGINPQTILTITDNDEIPFESTLEPIISGYPYEILDFSWTPDEQRIFFAQRQGVVNIYDVTTGEVLPESFLDISEKVNIGGQRGLLSMILHPEFSTNPYVYIGYSYDPPDLTGEPGERDGPDGDGPRVTRVVRVTADQTTNYTTAVPGSEVILYEGEAGFSPFHATGGMKFAPDGSLFFTIGDGHSVTQYSPALKQVQDLDKSFGKLFRVDPLTGEGFPDNPFFDGDVNSNQSKIYSYGFRNPWRIAINDETGEIYIGDVGWANYEEINKAEPGANYGWPFYEGGYPENLPTPGFVDTDDAQEFFAQNLDITPPLYGYPHDGFHAVGVGDFYRGNRYPEIYQDSLMAFDFSQREIFALTFDDNNELDSVLRLPDLNNQQPIQVLTGPDSYIYVLLFREGTLYRLNPVNN